MRRRGAIRIHIDDELYEIIRCHPAAERIYEVAAVSDTKIFQAFESLARWFRK
jgi:hypothetical protein